MTPVLPSHSTASHVARDFHRRALLSGMSAITFAQRLADAYHAATPLPDGLDLEFRRELAHRLGFIGAVPPQASAPAADVGTLAAEFGRTMQALAPLLADGRIDATDCPALVRQALREGTDLMAAWMTMQQALIAALPREGRA